MVKKDQDPNNNPGIDQDPRMNKNSSKLVTNGRSNGSVDGVGNVKSSPAARPQASA